MVLCGCAIVHWLRVPADAPRLLKPFCCTLSAFFSPGASLVRSGNLVSTVGSNWKAIFRSKRFVKVPEYRDGSSRENLGKTWAKNSVFLGCFLLCLWAKDSRINRV